ncbi:MAG: hypothetical protein COU10_01800 [Candidatus Harrisonbacteria bacterium CG10_big_fil_rev_8_21_14_0_10_45_28]|uniref:Uncharacterized protein n=1 Tax=Candidatus Harrisonbacteria bacterium CG10_big_fil_rev_8_21_14_0_10_45_28 TaxID=1974586 RepID=A0A2H0UQL7_9BACT|nr:MAG: hypothetical protein COU10_01800 [Candidatus Harrisonbacteria bacterium CG10_big_fil_rev_8_21_14_0_10_45_28]
MSFKSLFFRNTSVRQTVFKNTSWLFIGELIGRVIRFSIVIYGARVLGAATYGVFSYALTIAAFLTIFSDLGLSPVLTRETAKNPALRQKYFSSAFALKRVLLLMNVLVLLFILPFLTRVPDANALFIFVLFIFVFDSTREFGFGMSRSLETMEKEALAKIIMNLAVAGLGFWFLSISASAAALAWAYALGTGIGLLVTVILLWKYFRRIFSEVDWGLIWPLFKMALPIGILGVLGAITINTDMIMLGWWRSASEIGYYAGAQKIILLLYVLPTLLASAAFPVFSRLANVNNTRFRKVFEQVMTMSVLLALPIFVGGVILAPALVNFLFGAEYMPGVMTLQILFFTILIMFSSAVIPNALFAYNRQKLFLAFAGVGAFGNVLLNWLLIPRFGIEGSAVATVITQLLSNGLVWWWMKRTNNFSILKYLVRPVVATIVMGGACYWLSLAGVHLLLIVLAGMAIYFAILAILKEPLIREVRNILRVR